LDELLRNLAAGSRVLDLGSAGGSFQADSRPLTIIRLDLEFRPEAGPDFVMADAAKMPFANRSIDLVIANHSLEHIECLDDCLNEIGRVVKPNSGLFISVPDASTLSDKIYRWLGRGGGHVNPFVSAPLLAAKIEKLTGLRHNATRTLCSSLSFMNRLNQRSKAPRKLLLLGGGTEASLRWMSYAFRWSDRVLKTRASVYGWAFYFGSLHPEGPNEARTNVCIRCGSGHASTQLLADRRKAGRAYDCPNCGARNFFSDDGNYHHLAAAE